MFLSIKWHWDTGTWCRLKCSGESCSTIEAVKLSCSESVRIRYPPYRGIHPCSCAVNHWYLIHCPCYRKWAVNSTFHKWADNCLSAGARSLTMPYPPISWKPSRCPRPVQTTAGKRNQNDLPCIWPKQGYAWYLCEWVQGKEIVIPYVGFKKGVKSLRKELRDKLIQHRPDHWRHSEPTDVAVKT